MLKKSYSKTGAVCRVTFKYDNAEQAGSAVLAGEFNGGQQTISTYLEGKGTANKALLPILREAFPELLSKRQTFSLADDSLRMALSELATLDLTHAPAHALGEAFQALIGPRLRGERGQFFTPK